MNTTHPSHPETWNWKAIMAQYGRVQRACLRGDWTVEVRRIMLGHAGLSELKNRKFRDTTPIMQTIQAAMIVRDDRQKRGGVSGTLAGHRAWLLARFVRFHASVAASTVIGRKLAQEARERADRAAIRAYEEDLAEELALIEEDISMTTDESEIDALYDAASDIHRELNG